MAVNRSGGPLLTVSAGLVAAADGPGFPDYIGAGSFVAREGQIEIVFFGQPGFIDHRFSQGTGEQPDQCRKWLLASGVAAAAIGDPKHRHGV